MEYVKFNVRFSEELYGWLKAESVRTGVSMTSYVVMALETYKRQNEALVTVEDFYKQLQIEKLKEEDN